MIIPFIILGGALQSCGAAMNGQLNKHVVNPWLASAISFALITFLFTGASLIHPHPLPTQKDLAELPWWAVVGGLVGAVQVYAGLTLVNKVGAGPFMGFTVRLRVWLPMLHSSFLRRNILFQYSTASAEPCVRIVDIRLW